MPHGRTRSRTRHRLLRSLGHDVRRAKDEFEEGTPDDRLLAFAREADRVIVTCDKRFTVIERERTGDHAGVIYADQPHLQKRPEDAAHGVDRIVTVIPPDDRPGNEFYLSDWI